MFRAALVRRKFFYKILDIAAITCYTTFTIFFGCAAYLQAWCYVRIRDVLFWVYGLLCGQAHFNLRKHPLLVSISACCLNEKGSPTQKPIDPSFLERRYSSIMPALPHQPFRTSPSAMRDDRLKPIGFSIERSTPLSS